jgi:phosphate transport system permease protein
MEIWNNSQDPSLAAQNRAWGAALTLIALVFLFTLIARVVSARFSQQTR